MVLLQRLGSVIKINCLDVWLTERSVRKTLFQCYTNTETDVCRSVLENLLSVQCVCVWGLRWWWGCCQVLTITCDHVWLESGVGSSFWLLWGDIRALWWLISSHCEVVYWRFSDYPQVKASWCCNLSVCDWIILRASESRKHRNTRCPSMKHVSSRLWRTWRKYGAPTLKQLLREAPEPDGDSVVSSRQAIPVT